MYVFYAYSNVQCYKLFTLCSAMHYTYMTVLCLFTVHTVQYVVQNALCYTGEVVIVFSLSLFCDKACIGAGGQGTAAHFHIP